MPEARRDANPERYGVVLSAKSLLARPRTQALSRFRFSIKNCCPPRELAYKTRSQGDPERYNVGVEIAVERQLRWPITTETANCSKKGRIARRRASGSQLRGTKNEG